mgnify:CR=1 FL=1|jgi:hypothetical protein
MLTRRYAWNLTTRVNLKHLNRQLVPHGSCMAVSASIDSRSIRPHQAMSTVCIVSVAPMAAPRYLTVSEGARQQRLWPDEQEHSPVHARDPHFASSRHHVSRRAAVFSTTPFETSQSRMPTEPTPTRPDPAPPRPLSCAAFCAVVCRTVSPYPSLTSHLVPSPCPIVSYTLQAQHWGCTQALRHGI